MSTRQTPFLLLLVLTCAQTSYGKIPPNGAKRGVKNVPSTLQRRKEVFPKSVWPFFPRGGIAAARCCLSLHCASRPLKYITGMGHLSLNGPFKGISQLTNLGPWAVWRVTTDVEMARSDQGMHRNVTRELKQRTQGLFNRGPFRPPFRVFATLTL